MISSTEQDVICSGESGSGKTHHALRMLRQLYNVVGGGCETDSFKHLQASLTVLRSLGSAATLTNQDSSRMVSNVDTVYVTVQNYFIQAIHFPVSAAIQHSMNILKIWTHKGAYMTNITEFIHKLRKKIKCDTLPSILSLFLNKFNKFNNVGA